VRRPMLHRMAPAAWAPVLGSPALVAVASAVSAWPGKRLAWTAMVAEEPRRMSANSPVDSDVRDSTLAERARSGDEDAFSELFHRHAAQVGRVCRRILGPAAPVDDAVSETFLRVRRSLDGYAPDRPFRTWMLSIARHYCVDQLRRRSLERTIFASTDGETIDWADPGPTPLKRITLREERAAVLAAIEELPEKYRLPLVLRYYNEMDYAEIGAVLGVESARVGTLLFRARRRLRDRLAPGNAP